MSYMLVSKAFFFFCCLNRRCACEKLIIFFLFCVSKVTTECCLQNILEHDNTDEQEGVVLNVLAQRKMASRFLAWRVSMSLPRSGLNILPKTAEGIVECKHLNGSGRLRGDYSNLRGFRIVFMTLWIIFCIPWRKIFISFMEVEWQADMNVNIERILREL